MNSPLLYKVWIFQWMWFFLVLQTLIAYSSYLKNTRFTSRIIIYETNLHKLPRSFIILKRLMQFQSQYVNKQLVDDNCNTNSMVPVLFLVTKALLQHDSRYTWMMNPTRDKTANFHFNILMHVLPAILRKPDKN